jgi:hypothetical protein
MSLEQQTGLTARDFEMITQAAARQPEIERLILFGSRAKGNYRNHAPDPNFRYHSMCNQKCYNVRQMSTKRRV